MHHLHNQKPQVEVQLYTYNNVNILSNFFYLYGLE